MNRLRNYMKGDSNYAYTENGALTHKSSGDALYNLFSLAGSYRSRSDEMDLMYEKLNSERYKNIC